MIQSLFSTLFQVIVPLALPVVAGALLSKYKQLEIKPLLTLVLYYLTPALIFHTLMNAEVSSRRYKTFAFSISSLILLWAIANGLGKLLRYRQMICRIDAYFSFYK